MEFLSLLLRWLHVITGIAWIGSSFYFIWLDNSLEAPGAGSDNAKKGVAGELWVLVDRCREAGLDPEAELRQVARDYREHVLATEAAQ